MTPQAGQESSSYAQVLQSLNYKNRTSLLTNTGVYAPAVFRFRMHFPPAYPFAPPVITFTTDIFHPLITPLTTYTYTGPPQGDGTEAQQLPPGALSLRHGFPMWYETALSRADGEISASIFKVEASEASKEEQENVTVAEILRYMRTCFEKEAVLDAIPFEAAANPSAWYAWQSHRGRKRDPLPATAETGSSPRPRGPSDWNWEGVWDERVKRAVQGSLSEAALFGSAGIRDDDIRFANLGEEELKVMSALLYASERPRSR